MSLSGYKQRQSMKLGVADLDVRGLEMGTRMAVGDLRESVAVGERRIINLL